ncbi:unnamed protein product [Calypogeia fissa]
MGQGDGEESYSKNSGYQAILNKISQPVLYESLEKMMLSHSFNRGHTMVVADLGCSSSSNSINNVGLIVDKLRQLHVTGQDVNFQAFFNDLPSNDFNNLFQLLGNDRSRAEKFFVAGVPGSFFGRLFPPSSVHVFHSSWSIHWMSKVPDVFLDKDSPSYNRGNPWITNASPAAIRAYQQQASIDLKNFLLARAAELVQGGLLFFSFIGRSTVEANKPTNDLMTTFLMDLVEVWSDLVAKGLLTEEQLDTFNIPCYVRSIEEVQQALESCGSWFDVLTVKFQKLEICGHEVFATRDAIVIATKMKSMLKSILNNLLEAHLGKNDSEAIWAQYEKLVKNKVHMTPQNLMMKNSICIISLIRK